MEGSREQINRERRYSMEWNGIIHEILLKRNLWKQSLEQLKIELRIIERISSSSAFIFIILYNVHPLVLLSPLSPITMTDTSISRNCFGSWFFIRHNDDDDDDDLLLVVALVYLLIQLINCCCFSCSTLVFIQCCCHCCYCYSSFVFIVVFDLAAASHSLIAIDASASPSVFDSKDEF